MAYEFHTYDPHSYTHQRFDWAGTAGTASTYPNDDLYVSGAGWLSFTAANRARPGAAGWQAIESGLVAVTNPQANTVALCFQAADIGKDGCVYADDLYIDVYSEDGNLIRSVPCETAEYHGAFSFWARNGRRVRNDALAEVFTACFAGEPPICPAQAQSHPVRP